MYPNCRMKSSAPLTLAVLLLAAPGAAPQSAPPADAEGIAFFEKKIRPVLAARCYECHSARAEKLRGGLHLDSPEGILRGGNSGAALAPGRPAESLLVRAIRHADEELRLPPKGKLADGEIADIESWILRGAPVPRAAGAAPAGPSAAAHWAFRPPGRPAPPPVRLRDWPINLIDPFILHELEKLGLRPAPEADRRTLLRRLSADLTGLPPAPTEVEAFEKDSSPDAVEKAVDRLLSSPRFGERWGRHWLDVARYSDTKGYVFREERRFPFSHTYRDWVIRALNEDLPYDRFLLQQIAADGLDVGDDRRPLAALGFLTLGRRFLNREPDIIDDRIDVVTRGTMALTVSCARCHDHKYDPFSMKDYYALYGVFAGSREPRNLPVIGPALRGEETLAYEKELARRQAEAAKFRESRFDTLAPPLRSAGQIAEYLQAAHEARGLADENALRGFAQKRDLKGLVLERWIDHLRRHGPGDPVFGPWHGAKPGPGVNPLVARALAGKAPGKEAAEAYGSLLAEFDRTAPEEDPDREALRRVVRGPDAPPDVPLDHVDRILNRADRDKLRDLDRKIEELRATHPGAPEQAMALEDAPAPPEARVFIRGNPANPGEAVPRRFLALLGGRVFTQGSGRLELARAIADPANPLTARVLVNRVWSHLLGAGLVRTPSDFGVRSDPPSHPELLDWLARRFIEDGWSIKKLIRLIALSATYRQSSRDDARARAEDPDNRLLWRANRRRLDFEAMRDSLLAVSGGLDLTMGGRAVPISANPTVKTRQDAETIRNEGGGDPSQSTYSGRRSVYLFIDRQNLPSTFRDFDFASPDTHSPQRHRTTVPQQALYLMNSPFVAEQARRLAARPEVAGEAARDRRIAALHRIVFGRAPTPEEAALGARFVEGEGDGALKPWEKYAQVLLISNEFMFID